MHHGLRWHGNCYIIGMAHTVLVAHLPDCDICKHLKSRMHPEQVMKAKYDGKTKLRGIWAYMCQACFDELGIGLGVGKGQELVLSE